MEASGTSNMKFAMNGCVLIETLDGANVEIRQGVGEDNFFLFGAQAHEIAALRKERAEGKVQFNSIFPLTMCPESQIEDLFPLFLLYCFLSFSSLNIVA